MKQLEKWAKKLLAALTMALLVCAMLPTSAMAEQLGDYDNPEKFSTIQAAAEEYVRNYMKTDSDEYYFNSQPLPEDKIKYVDLSGGSEWKGVGDAVIVVYHANYDYTSTSQNDIISIVVYMGAGDLKFQMPTAAELGFTEEGYIQDEDDPWDYHEAYLKKWRAGWEFYFENGDYDEEYYYAAVIRGEIPVRDLTKKGNSKVGTYHRQDGSGIVHVQTNWKTKGDPVDVPDPVEPKPENPTLDKKVNGGDSTSVNAGESADFTLTSNIPADLWKCFDFGGDAEIQTLSVDNKGTAIKDAKYKLTFHDTMHNQLTMNNDLTVTIGGRALTANQYTYTTNTDDGCTFHVELDLVDLYSNNVITDADYENQTSIVVSYSAMLNNAATAGTYQNAAHVSWSRKIVDRGDPTDPVDPDNPPKDPDDPDDPPESEEDKVDVYTYKIQLNKTDKNTSEPLAEAKFKLEKKDDGDNWTTVVEESATDEEGIVSWDGLKEGTYRLTETAAPTGYVKDSTPVEIMLPGDAGTTKVVNVAFTNGEAPHTGGSGTLAYTVVGLAILAVAGVGFVVSRKKDR